ncbi:MAG: hypothetical protein PUB21_11865 [Bacteroidales bacterium]|nr:hypothetical protein [Bacteroidales bacterium]
MLYDLSNPLHKEQFKTRCNFLFQKNAIVELTEKKPKRTNQQNRYLHLILGFFAVETGNTLEFVKTEYFKKLVNPDIFIREKEDKYLGKIKILRSSADLDTSESNLSIERFRNWSSSEAGIYLAAPNEEKLLQLIEIELERNKRYL